MELIGNEEATKEIERFLFFFKEQSMRQSTTPRGMKGNEWPELEKFIDGRQKKERAMI